MPLHAEFKCGIALDPWWPLLPSNSAALKGWQTNSPLLVLGSQVSCLCTRTACGGAIGIVGIKLPVRPLRMIVQSSCYVPLLEVHSDLPLLLQMAIIPICFLAVLDIYALLNIHAFCGPQSSHDLQWVSLVALSVFPR